MTGDRTGALSPDAAAVSEATRPSSLLLWGSALLSAALLLLPGLMLWYVWPGVRYGATCNLVHQPWCRPGYGLPQWYVVAAVCLASGALHGAALLRETRPGAGRLSLLGLLAAASALALVTIAPALLSGVLPDGWFMT